MDDYEKLILLRNTTKLNLIDLLRIKRACNKAENTRNMLAKCDPTHSYSTDYREALNLEINLRIRALKENLYDEWKKYLSVEKDGFTLDQYVQRFLDDYENSRSKKM